MFHIVAFFQIYSEAENNASLLAIAEAHQLYVAVRPNIHKITISS